MNKQKTVVVLGKFDGVHVAHARLITRAVSIAKEKNAICLVYSMQKSNVPAITDKDKKISIITGLGADKVVLRELDREFMMLTAEKFVSDILIGELNACHVVVGENFRFGKDRSAGVKELGCICRKYGVDVYVLDTVEINSETVSSTFVKQLLSCGNVYLAAEYLGRPFSINGKISEGKHLGRLLGFPTANLYPENLEVLPANGVYVTKVEHGGKCYPSITNVGVNPTVENGKNIKVETHIFGDTCINYGDEITVEFMEFIRPEIRFESSEQLSTQVEEDKKRARNYHGI